MLNRLFTKTLTAVSFRSASAFSFCFWRNSLILFKNSRLAEYGRGMLNLASRNAKTVQTRKYSLIKIKDSFLIKEVVTLMLVTDV